MNKEEQGERDGAFGPGCRDSACVGDAALSGRGAGGWQGADSATGGPCPWLPRAVRFFVPAWGWARRPLAASESPGLGPELRLPSHSRQRASPEQPAAPVPSRRLPSGSRLCRELRVMEQPWNSCLSLLPGKVELRVANTVLSSLAWGRERTHWNLLPEDAHSDLGRESNSRTGAVFRSPGCPLLLAAGTWEAEAGPEQPKDASQNSLNKSECGPTSVSVSMYVCV